MQHRTLEIKVKLLNDDDFSKIVLRSFSSWQNELFLFTCQLSFSYLVILNGIFTKEIIF